MTSRRETTRPTHLRVGDLRVDIVGERSIERAVRGVDVRAAAGRVHAVIGESGSGKSTVVRAISGALPPTATVRGRIDLLTDEPKGIIDVLAASRSSRSLLPPTSRLAGTVIGTMPQSAATALTPVRTFGTQLAETCAELGSENSIEELITSVGLTPRDGLLYPHELSGGMAQRAAFALAVAGNPPLLLADEPTSALDPELTDLLLGMLRRHADSGGTVLLVTHDIEQLEHAGIADEISVMYRGRIVESGSAEQVLSAPSHPYTRLLLAALPSRGLHFPTAAQWRAAHAEFDEVTS